MWIYILLGLILLWLFLYSFKNSEPCKTNCVSILKNWLVMKTRQAHKCLKQINNGRQYRGNTLAKIKKWKRRVKWWKKYPEWTLTIGGKKIQCKGPKISYNPGIKMGNYDVLPMPKPSKTIEVTLMWTQEETARLFGIYQEE